MIWRAAVRAAEHFRWWADHHTAGPMGAPKDLSEWLAPGADPEVVSRILQLGRVGVTCHCGVGSAPQPKHSPWCPAATATRINAG
jgi:hypothetical protein